MGDARYGRATGATRLAPDDLEIANHVRCQGKRLDLLLVVALLVGVGAHLVVIRVANHPYVTVDADSANNGAAKVNTRIRARDPSALAQDASNGRLLEYCAEELALGLMVEGLVLFSLLHVELAMMTEVAVSMEGEFLSMVWCVPAGGSTSNRSVLPV
jgi:hypothetical protein